MISEGLARLERMPPSLAIHILPAHQELIAPLPSGYVGPAISNGEDWLRRFGYKALGPWLISWGSNGQPQLRRPVSGALRAVDEGQFRTLEMPPLLMLAVPFQGWPVLPHNLMPYVQRQGFEALGQPLLLALGNEPPTIAWVPVMPRGTMTLAQAVSTRGLMRKIGLFPPPPQPGVLLSLHDLLRGAALSTLHTLVGLSLLLLFLGGCPLLLAAMAAASLFASPLGMLGSALATSLLAFGLIFLGRLLAYWRAMAKWNRFWRDRPAPPVLAIHGFGVSDAEIPAWFNGGS